MFDDTSVDADCSTFTLFPKLPTELRLKIWKEACLFEEIIDVHTVFKERISSQPVGRRRDNLINLLFTYSSRSCPPPTVLHISQESCEVGLDHFSSHLYTKSNILLGSEFVSFTALARIYVNPEIDILCILPFVRKDSDEAPTYYTYSAFATGCNSNLRSFAALRCSTGLELEM